MVQLNIDKLTKSFGDLVLFEDISFGIEQGQKIGLIAKNGSGKTTLLNIIAGKEDYDSGSVVFRNDLRVGYLEQAPSYPEEMTVLQACFYSQNETVRLLAEYEQALLDNDSERLTALLERMDSLKAWDYEQRAKQILGELKIPVETDERIFVKFGNAYSEESDELIIIPDSDGKYNIAWLMYEFIEMTLPMSRTHADGGCDEAMMTIYHRYSVDSCGEGAAHDGIKKGENKGFDPRWAALKNILDNN